MTEKGKRREVFDKRIQSYNQWLLKGFAFDTNPLESLPIKGLWGVHNSNLSLAEIIQTKKSEFAKTKGVGKVSLEQIDSWLKSIGLGFKAETDLSEQELLEQKKELMESMKQLAAQRDGLISEAKSYAIKIGELKLQLRKIEAVLNIE